MRVDHDRDNDLAYIYLVPDDASIEHGRTVTLESVDALGEAATDLILDFDREGRLTGIEVLAADSLLRPETLAEACSTD